MNGLLAEMKRTMEELRLGLDGALNFSPAMEALATAVAQNKARSLAAGTAAVQHAGGMPALQRCGTDSAPPAAAPWLRRCRRCGWHRCPRASRRSSPSQHGSRCEGQRARAACRP